MSGGDVHPHEMDTPYEFDDHAAEALLGGHGRQVDPALAEVLGDLRASFASAPPVLGAELSALLAGGAVVTSPSSPFARRFERVRSSMIAKIGAATAAIVAATGGLAVAHALPAPIQDAFSHIGVGAPAHHGDGSSGGETSGEATTTTTVGSTTTVPDAGGSTDTTVPGGTTTTGPGDNHGSQVSAVAHDHGCDHGADVSQVASGGRSQNPNGDASGANAATGGHDAQDSCSPGAGGGHQGSGQHGSGQNNNQGGNHQGDNHQGGSGGHDGTPPTTIAGGTTPTSEPHSGGSHGGGQGGNTGSGGGSHGGTTGPGGHG